MATEKWPLKSAIEMAIMAYIVYYQCRQVAPLYSDRSIIDNDETLAICWSEMEKFAKPPDAFA